MAVLVIDATATDAEGNVASASVAVTVNVPGEAPAAPAVLIPEGAKDEPGFMRRFREAFGGRS